MKEVACRKCGDPVERGFDTPYDAEFCGNCGEECPKCGEWDVLENGKCFMCNETII